LDRALTLQAWLKAMPSPPRIRERRGSYKAFPFYLIDFDWLPA
jgi:hypothetical protein